LGGPAVAGYQIVNPALWSVDYSWLGFGNQEF